MLSRDYGKIQSLKCSYVNNYKISRKTNFRIEEFFLTPRFLFWAMLSYFLPI